MFLLLLLLLVIRQIPTEIVMIAAHQRFKGRPTLLPRNRRMRPRLLRHAAGPRHGNGGSRRRRRRRAHSSSSAAASMQFFAKIVTRRHSSGGGKISSTGQMMLQIAHIQPTPTKGISPTSTTTTSTLVQRASVPQHLQDAESNLAARGASSGAAVRPRHQRRKLGGCIGRRVRRRRILGFVVVERKVRSLQRRGETVDSRGG